MTFDRPPYYFSVGIYGIQFHCKWFSFIIADYMPDCRRRAYWRGVSLSWAKHKYPGAMRPKEFLLVTDYLLDEERI